MEDENNKKEEKKKIDHLHNEEARKKSKAASITHMEKVKAVKKLSNPNSDWHLTQEILQEIMAGYKIKNPEKMPKTPQLVEDLKREIKLRYEDSPETRDLLLESIPNVDSVRRFWIRAKGWEEAVWRYIRKDGLFTQGKRSEMIDALYKRGLEKSDTAAKIWLTLSGDYSEKDDKNKDATQEIFREINSVLHKKKEY